MRKYSFFEGLGGLEHHQARFFPTLTCETGSGYSITPRNSTSPRRRDDGYRCAGVGICTEHPQAENHSFVSLHVGLAGEIEWTLHSGRITLIHRQKLNGPSVAACGHVRAGIQHTADRKLSGWSVSMRNKVPYLVGWLNVIHGSTGHTVNSDT